VQYLKLQIYDFRIYHENLRICDLRTGNIRHLRIRDLLFLHVRTSKDIKNKRFFLSCISIDIQGFFLQPYNL
jgi:hypothetical protein